MYKRKEYIISEDELEYLLECEIQYYRMLQGLSKVAHQDEDKQIAEMAKKRLVYYKEVK